MASNLPMREECQYAACYCEENIWKLCEMIKEVSPDLMPFVYVVFCSNATKSIPLWCQKASVAGGGGAVFWDYHVFMTIDRPNNGKSVVLDLDTTLDFPCDFVTYCENAIGDDTYMNDRFQRFFRIVNANDYLRLFSSDRSHMKNKNGKYSAPLPPWPPIFNEVNNLAKFWTMDSNVQFDCETQVLDAKQFVDKFSS